MTTIADTRSRFLSVGEVAFALNLSEATVRRLIAKGVLPATQLGGPGAALRIATADLEARLSTRPQENA